MIGAIVCGIKDGKFYGTIYGYPADESADGKEQEIDDTISEQFDVVKICLN